MSTRGPQNYVKFDPHDIKEPKSLECIRSKQQVQLDNLTKSTQNTIVQNFEKKPET